MGAVAGGLGGVWQNIGLVAVRSGHHWGVCIRTFPQQMHVG